MRLRSIPREQAYLELAGIELEASAPSALAQLRLACSAVLELEDVPAPIRIRVVELVRAMEDPGRLEVVRAVLAEPRPTTRPSQRADHGWLHKLLRGEWRDLADAAVDAGFTAERTHGGQRIRFLAPPPSTATLVVPAGGAPGDHRAIANARAAARRAGVPI